MLVPWIIDKIRRREQDRQDGDRLRIELPVPEPEWPGEGDPRKDRDGQGDRAPERGVAILGMESAPFRHHVDCHVQVVTTAAQDHSPQGGNIAEVAADGQGDMPVTNNGVVGWIQIDEPETGRAH